jgi:prepilin-type processing-associated H-X9-DG protein
LLLPAIQAAREAARRTQCTNNIKQLGLAAQNYLTASRDTLPGGLYQEQKIPGGQQGETFFVHLLPYMEEQSVFDRWDFELRAKNSCAPNGVPPCGTDSPAGTVIEALLCPSDNPAERQITSFLNSQNTSGGQNMAHRGYYAITSYAGNHGTKSYYSLATSSGRPATDDGMFTTYGPNGMCYAIGSTPTPCRTYDKGITLKSVTDGLSKTILFGEHYNQDEVFDTITSAGRSGYLIHQWSMWSWTGGLKGTGHTMRSGWLEINRRCPESCRGASDFLCQDERLTTWGSGHPGGANFVMGDGSSRFINEDMSLIALQAMSTRNKGENVSDQ